MKQVAFGLFLTLSGSFCGAMYRTDTVKLTYSDQMKLASGQGVTEGLRDLCENGSPAHKRWDKLYQDFSGSLDGTIVLDDSGRDRLLDLTNRIVPKELNFDEDDQ